MVGRVVAGMVAGVGVKEAGVGWVGVGVRVVVGERVVCCRSHS